MQGMWTRQILLKETPEIPLEMDSWAAMQEDLQFVTSICHYLFDVLNKELNIEIKSEAVS